LNLDQRRGHVQPNANTVSKLAIEGTTLPAAADRSVA